MLGGAADEAPCTATMPMQQGNDGDGQDADHDRAGDTTVGEGADQQETDRRTAGSRRS